MLNPLDSQKEDEYHDDIHKVGQGNYNEIDRSTTGFRIQGHYLHKDSSASEKKKMKTS